MLNLKPGMLLLRQSDQAYSYIAGIPVSRFADEVNEAYRSPKHLDDTGFAVCDNGIHQTWLIDGVLTRLTVHPIHDISDFVAIEC